MTERRWVIGKSRWGWEVGLHARLAEEITPKFRVLWEDVNGATASEIAAKLRELADMIEGDKDEPHL